MKKIKTIRRLTSRQTEALKIIQKEPRIRAEIFAKEFWPGHVMHRAISNQGNGACAGKKAWRCAGAYLGKLRRAGLVEAENTAANSSNRIVFSLTYAGERAIAKEGGV